MYNTYPIYIPSIEYASKNNELDLWEESHKINLECKKYIDKNISMAYYNRTLPEFRKELLNTYGIERAIYVMARTINYKEWDGRFSKEVKERAKKIKHEDSQTTEVLNDNCNAYSMYDKSAMYITDAHPAYLNELFRYLMKEEKEIISVTENSQENENMQEADR